MGNEQKQGKNKVITHAEREQERRQKYGVKKDDTIVE